MSLLRQIDMYLEEHREEIIRNLCKFVEIPSIRDEETEEFPYGKECERALRFCMDLAEEKGMSVKNYENRCAQACLYENKPDSDRKRLVIASHADVVPITEEEWIYPPFGQTVDKGYVIGRGVVDDKGPLIASIYALAFFKKYHLSLNHDIRLVFGSNEEMGMDDLEYYLEQEGQPDLGLSIDDDFPVVNGEKGLLRFEIGFNRSEEITYIQTDGPKQVLLNNKCKYFHNDVEYQVDAGGDKEFLHKLLNLPLFQDKNQQKWIESVSKDVTGETLGILREDDVSGKTSLKVYAIHSDEQKVWVQFDARLPVSADLDKIWKEVVSCAEKQGVNVRLIKKSPGYYLSEDDPMVSMLTNLYNQESNSNDKPYIMSACTYARMFRYGFGFGAGNPHEKKPFPTINGVYHGGAHGPDEAHNIDVLMHAIRIYILAIAKIDETWSK